MIHDAYTDSTISIPAASEVRVIWQPATVAHCLMEGGVLQQRNKAIRQICGESVERGWSVQHGVTPQEQMKTITDIWVLMEQRYNQLMEDPDARDLFDPILLVVEAEYLVQAAHADAIPLANVKLLVDVLRLARAAKIHVLICASTATAAALPDEVQDNLGFRVHIDRYLQPA